MNIWVSQHVQWKIEQAGGITIDPYTGQEPTAGFAVSLPGGRIVDGIPTIAQIRNFYFGNQRKFGNFGFFGAWFDDSTGKTHLDITTIQATLRRALECARAGKQKCIFDLATGETIGTGVAA